MKQKSGPENVPAEQVLKDIRRQTRRQYSAEEKMRIVLAGLSYVLRDLLIGIENANGGAGSDLILGADNAANRLAGNAGNDFLYGYSGDDVLIGGTALVNGFNYLSGSAGSDTEPPRVCRRL